MENIQVAMRLRPLNQAEKDAGEFVPWRVKNNSIEIVRQDNEPSLPNKKPQKLTFTFDHCFNDATTNETVYNQVAKSVILSCLEGYNGTIFMYGQTGSGKTYTMLGYNNSGGLYNAPQIGGLQDMTTNEITPIKDEKHMSLGIEGFDEKYPEFVYDSSACNFEGNTGILIQSLKDIFKAIEQVFVVVTNRTRKEPSF